MCYIAGGVCGSIMYGVLLEYRKKYKFYMNMIAITSLRKYSNIFILMMRIYIVSLGFATWTFFYGIIFITCIATFLAGLSMLP